MGGGVTDRQAPPRSGIRALVAELYRRSPLLTVNAFVYLALAGAMAVATVFDPRTVLGIDPWIKPMKFALSFAFYLFTIAWIVNPLPRTLLLRVVEIGIAVAMAVELAAIGTQAGRGTTSHYNVSTPFDAAVFQTMGIMILFNTLLLLVLLIRFFGRTLPVDPLYRWGIRLGLAMFIVGSIQGMTMIQQSAHTVGLADGGPGLPVVNWSTRGGDLRIAHAVALHGLQLFPLVAWWLGRTSLPPVRRAVAFALFVVAYVALFAGMVVQALTGTPLWRASDVAAAVASRAPAGDSLRPPRGYSFGFSSFRCVSGTVIRAAEPYQSVSSGTNTPAFTAGSSSTSFSASSIVATLKM